MIMDLFKAVLVMLMKGFKNGKLEKLLGKEIHVLGKL
jgi:hypothetical protein